MATNPAVDRIAKNLQRQEETSTAGANVLTPKQQLLDAREVEKQNPDRRVRWVSLKNPDKMLSRKMEGFEILPEDKGGRRLGDNLVLMSQPRERYEQRVKAQEKLAKQRLNQHRDEMRNLAEGLAKQLRDRHGIDIDVDRLLVNEDA